jgi:hypothetical protein
MKRRGFLARLLGTAAAVPAALVAPKLAEAAKELPKIADFGATEPAPIGRFDSINFITVCPTYACFSTVSFDGRMDDIIYAQKQYIRK